MSNFLDNMQTLAVIAMLLGFTALSVTFAVYVWLEIIIPKL